MTPAEDEVGPRPADRLDPVKSQIAGEIHRVPVLLGEKQPDRLGIVRVADAGRVGRRPRSAVYSLGTLAELEVLERRQQDAALAFAQGEGAVPRDRPLAVRVLAEVLAPPE